MNGTKLNGVIGHVDKSALEDISNICDKQPLCNHKCPLVKFKYPIGCSDMPILDEDIENEEVEVE